MIAIAKASLQYVHAAVNSYWPSIPGATATETCDAERGDCDTPKPKTLPGKKDLRKLMASRKYSFKQNAAFIQKTDKTLRGAIVVIADCNHNDPKVQADLTYFKRWGAKYGKEHGKDKLLLESPNEKGKKLSMMCEAWSPPATCVGIESSVLEQRLIDATSECLDAATNLIILMQEAGSPIAAEINRPLDQTMIEKAWQEVRSKMWGSLDADEKSELNKYYALFNKEYAQIDPKVEALDKDRADWYLQQIKLHFGEDHVTYVMLGFKHIYNLRARLMALKIPVVICSMIEMIDAYIPKGERAAWFDPEGIE